MQRSDYGMDDLGEHGEPPSPPSTSNETPMTEEGSGASTVFIPASLYANKEFRAGDEIILKVTRVDDDGLEAEYADGSGENESAPATMPMHEPESANSMIDRASTNPSY